MLWQLTLCVQVWRLVLELISSVGNLQALLGRMRKQQTVLAMIGYFSTSLDTELNDQVGASLRPSSCTLHASSHVVVCMLQLVEALGQIAALPEGRALLVSQGCTEMLSKLMSHAYACDMPAVISKICGTITMLCTDKQGKTAVGNAGLIKLMLSILSQTIAASKGTSVPPHIHAVLGALANVVDEQSTPELLDAESIRAFYSLLDRASRPACIDIGLAVPTSKLLAACLRSSQSDFEATIEPMLPKLVGTLAAVLAAGPDQVLVGALCELLLALTAGADQRPDAFWAVVCSAELVAALMFCVEMHVESKDLACHMLPVLSLLVQHAATEAVSVARTAAILGPLLRFNSNCRSRLGKAF